MSEDWADHSNKVPNLLGMFISEWTKRFTGILWVKTGGSADLSLHLHYIGGKPFHGEHSGFYEFDNIGSAELRLHYNSGIMKHRDAPLSHGIWWLFNNRLSAVILQWSRKDFTSGITRRVSNLSKTDNMWSYHSNGMIIFHCRCKAHMRHKVQRAHATNGTLVLTSDSFFETKSVYSQTVQLVFTMV
jgi:hypothetical protein